MEAGDFTSLDNENKKNQKGQADLVQVLEEGYKGIPVYKCYKNYSSALKSM